MKWFKLTFWLLAWSAWAYLGLGLYRELPRDPGPVVCRLPLNPAEQALGFLASRPSVVTIDDHVDARLPIIRVRNARTGAIELEASSDGVGIPRSFGFLNSFRHGFHGRCESSPPAPNSTSPVFLLDLSTGEWKKFDHVGVDPVFHPTKPWVAFCCDRKDDSVVVLDLKTGRRIFETRRRLVEKGFVRVPDPFFIGADRLGVPVRSQDGRNGPGFEIWSLTTGQMMRRLAGPRGRQKVANSSDGKLAWYDDESQFVTEVFDVEAGRRLLAIPAQPERVAWERRRAAAPVTPAFTSDNRRILSSLAGGLFDVESGNQVWAARDHEAVWIVRPPGRFELRERWSFSLFGRPVEFYTFAVRRLHDGAFLYRSRYSTLGEFRSNEEGTLFLADDNTVRELPMRVNCLYLATAQTILALPLILLWALLKVRHRRAARRQPPMEAMP